MGKAQPLEQMIEKLDIHIEKNETDPYLIPYTNINSKWIKDLNIIPKFIKEENRKSFMTLALVMISSWWHVGDIRSIVTEGKKYKRGYIKI